MTPLSLVSLFRPLPVFVGRNSVLPSPPYYAAKALVLGAYRLARRFSGAMLGSPRQL